MIKKLLFTIFVSIFTGFMIYLNLYFFAFAVILGFLSIIILSKRIEYGIYIVTAWVPLQYFLTKYYHVFPWHFVWIDEIIIFLMFLIIFFKKIILKQNFNFCSVDKYVFGFILCGIISAIFNKVNLVIALLGLRDLLQYYVFYFIVKNIKIREKAFKIICCIILITLFLQTPIGVYQFFSWKPAYLNKITNEYVNNKGLSYYDAVVGTFVVGANNFGYLMAIFMLFSLGLFFYYKNKKWLILPVYLFPVFCFSRGIGAFCIFFVSLFFLVRRGKDIIKFCCMLFLLIFMLLLYDFFYSEHFHRESNLFNFSKYLEGQLDISQGSSGRLIGIKVIHELLTKEAPSSMIGFGAGNFSSFTGRRFGAIPYVKAVNKLQSDRCFTENDIVMVLGEYGYIGYLLFLVMTFSLYRRNNFIYFNSKEPLRAICFASKGCFFIFCIGSIFTNIWTSQPLAFYIWLLAGSIESLFLQQKVRCDVSNSHNSSP